MVIILFYLTSDNNQYAIKLSNTERDSDNNSAIRIAHANAEVFVYPPAQPVAITSQPIKKQLPQNAILFSSHELSFCNNRIDNKIYFLIKQEINSNSIFR